MGTKAVVGPTTGTRMLEKAESIVGASVDKPVVGLKSRAKAIH
jgi:hypothetical protein